MPPDGFTRLAILARILECSVLLCLSKSSASLGAQFQSHLCLEAFPDFPGPQTPFLPLNLDLLYYLWYSQDDIWPLSRSNSTCSLYVLDTGLSAEGSHVYLGAKSSHCSLDSDSSRPSSRSGVMTRKLGRAEGAGYNLAVLSL